MIINQVVYDGNEVIGFWWKNIESEEDEFVSLEQIGAADISELTKLEQELYLLLGTGKYDALEEISDRYNTNPQEIVLAFINDLISSGSGTDDRIAHAARTWFYAKCKDGEFNS